MRAMMAAAVLALTAPGTALAAGCDCAKGPCVALKTGVEISGALVVRKSAYMVKLDRKTCFKGTGEEDDIMAGEDRPGVTFVQLAPDEGQVAILKGLVGKRVRLKGDAFGAHTRHHLTDALFAPKEISAE